MNLIDKIKMDLEDLSKPFAGMLDYEDNTYNDNEANDEEDHLNELDRECITSYDND